MNSQLNSLSARSEDGSRHQCLIYKGSPSRQLPALSAMVKRKLNEGHRCLYLNSPPMVAGMRSALAATGLDVAYEVANCRLVLSSESPAGSQDGFDVAKMLGMLEGAVDQAVNDGYRGLWATGDMTWEFGSEKNFVKLLEYENGLESLMHRRPELSGICQYHQDTLPCDAARQALLTHPQIFINETLAHINPHYPPTASADTQTVSASRLDKTLAAIHLFQTSQSGAA